MKNHHGTRLGASGEQRLRFHRATVQQIEWVSGDSILPV
jgi:hypothetical protein